MNFDDAFDALHHARTKKLLLTKSVCNKTKLTWAINTTEGALRVHLELFDKTILTWRPNGNIELSSAGHKTVTTADRYERYLPPGFRTWQERPYWYVGTPTGSRPFFDGMELRPDGYVLNLCPALNRVDARQLKDRVKKYSTFYANRLVNGVISGVTDRNHSTCWTCLRLGQSTTALSENDVEHFLQHVRQELTPPGLAQAAVNRLDHLARCFRGDRPMTRLFLRDVIKASWFESQQLWRKAKTKKALVEQTERLMTGDDLPRTDLRPRAHVVNIRMLIEDFLLESFGFESMVD